MLPFFDGTGTAGFASTAPLKQNDQDTKRTSCKAVEPGLLSPSNVCLLNAQSRNDQDTRRVSYHDTS